MRIFFLCLKTKEPEKVKQHRINEWMKCCAFPFTCRAATYYLQTSVLKKKKNEKNKICISNNNKHQQNAMDLNVLTAYITRLQFNGNGDGFTYMNI